MLARCLQYNKMRIICHDLMLINILKLVCDKTNQKGQGAFGLKVDRKEIDLHLFSGCVAIITMNKMTEITKLNSIPKNQNEEEKLLFHAIDISKAFDNKQILSDLNLQICADQRIALMGPSGSGKTTLLKIIAGIVQPDQGSVYLTPSVSMVFDEDDLYQELSAFRNIELGLDFSKSNKKERQEKVMFWAKQFSCLPFLDQLAATLSAGQRKRVALARAMMKEPNLLLLDETFHALDPTLRQETIQTLLRLQQEKHFALVFATHHEEEAKLLKAQVIEFDELSQG